MPLLCTAWEADHIRSRASLKRAMAFGMPLHLLVPKLQQLQQLQPQSPSGGPISLPPPGIDDPGTGRQALEVMVGRLGQRPDTQTTFAPALIPHMALNSLGQRLLNAFTAISRHLTAVCKKWETAMTSKVNQPKRTFTGRRPVAERTPIVINDPTLRLHGTSPAMKLAHNWHTTGISTLTAARIRHLHCKLVLVLMQQPTLE